jgi:hypothetical protein
MQKFKNLGELKSAPMSIYSEMEALMNQIGESLNKTGMLKSELTAEMIGHLDFMTYLGGDVFIVEEEYDDLDDIILFDHSISERAGPCDIAIILPTFDYAMLVVMSSDEGGATYFIPQEIYENNTNVLLSIILTNPQNIINSLTVSKND